MGEAYVRGDVRGDGTIETVDARMARFIGIGKYAPNPKQLIAGDVNLDNSVNSADAMMIIHRILYGDWPGAPAYEVIKTRKLRRGTPIVLSLEEVSGVSGSEVTAMLRISNLVKLSAMNLSIAFDTNVVEIVKVEKTGLTEETQFLANPDEAGVIHIGMDSQIPLNGDGDIAKITLRLVSGGSVRSTPLTIARANLYDLFGRDFVISALQRTIEAHHGEAIITDIPEEPIIEDRTVETPIDDLFPKPATTWLHSATCQINDHSGNPIAGATVTMGDKTVITDEYGYCAVVGLTEGEYTMTVNKDGYIVPDMPCQVGDEDNCRLNFMNLNVGMATPASCQLYVVHDEGLNNSQFLTISLDGLYTVNLLGPMYYGYDFES
ncbi:cohesin domain-containing protein, partial [Candidatus Marithioploca araucensis]|nr:cohesin domain-containing protein [Candidatus Marithioploca araucensis]